MLAENRRRSLRRIRKCFGLRAENPANVAGFSLIELLVVVTIVALLVSVLMPIVRLVRDQAQEARCANSMRQLGLAATAYGFDHEGYKVASSLYQGSVSWPVLLSPYLSIRQNLTDAMSTGVYSACPTWRRDPLFKKILALRGVGWVSFYGMGYSINSTPGRPQSLVADDWSNPWISGQRNFRLAAISSLSQRIAFAEHVKRNGDNDILTSCQDFFSGYGPESSQPGAALGWGGWRMSWDSITRHRGGANYVFFDGHVERARYPRSLAEGVGRGGPGLGHSTPDDPRWLSR